MAGYPAPECEVYWQNESEAVREAYKEVMASHQQAKAAVVKTYEIITDIARLAGCTPKEIGESQERANIVKKVETSRASLCTTLEGETLFNALYGVYMLAFIDQKSVLKKSAERKGKKKTVATHRPEEGFQEQKRKRRSSADDKRPDSAKKQETRTTRTETTTWNFLAQLRDMEIDAAPETGVTKMNR